VAGCRGSGSMRISYKRRPQVLTVVGRPRQRPDVWASQGRGKNARTVTHFRWLEASGRGRCAQIQPMSARTGPQWIADATWSAIDAPHAIRLRRPVSRRRLGHEASMAVRLRGAEQRPARGSHRNHGWDHGRRAPYSTGTALALRRARLRWRTRRTHDPPKGLKLQWIAKRPTAALPLPINGRRAHGLQLPVDKPARHWTGGSLGTAPRCRIRIGFVRCNVASLAPRAILASIAPGLSKRAHSSRLNTKVRIINPHGIRFAHPGPYRPGNAHLEGSDQPSPADNDPRISQQSLTQLMDRNGNHTQLRGAAAFDSWPAAETSGLVFCANRMSAVVLAAIAAVRLHHTSLVSTWRSVPPRRRSGVRPGPGTDACESLSQGLELGVAALEEGADALGRHLELRARVFDPLRAHSRMAAIPGLPAQRARADASAPHRERSVSGG